MRKVYLAVYGLCCCLALLMFFVIIPQFTPDADDYGMHSDVMPKCYSGIIALVSSGLFIQELFSKKSHQDIVKLRTMINVTVVYYIGIIFSYVLLLRIAHFMVAGFLLLLGLQWVMGQRNWLILISISIVFPLLGQYCMINLLNIPAL